MYVCFGCYSQYRTAEKSTDLRGNIKCIHLPHKRSTSPISFCTAEAISQSHVTTSSAYQNELQQKLEVHTKPLRFSLFALGSHTQAGLTMTGVDFQCCTITHRTSGYRKMFLQALSPQQDQPGPRVEEVRATPTPQSEGRRGPATTAMALLLLFSEGPTATGRFFWHQAYRTPKQNSLGQTL